MPLPCPARAAPGSHPARANSHSDVLALLAGAVCAVFALVRLTAPLSARVPLAEPTPLPEHYNLVGSWPVGELDRGLYHPEGVDIDRDGLIAVAEKGSHRVSYWHANGDLQGA